MKITIAAMLVNCLTFGLLAAYYDSPMHAAGSYHVPRTQITLEFGKPQIDYSRFIIPAKALAHK
jgi:hypothetical protein